MQSSLFRASSFVWARVESAPQAFLITANVQWSGRPDKQGLHLDLHA